MADESKPASGTPQAASSRQAARTPAAWSPFGTLRDQVDRLFEDFTRGFPALGRDDTSLSPWNFGSHGLRVPAVDVVERDDSYLLTAELPGLSEKDVEVTLRDQVLTVKGQKSSTREEDKDNVRISERQYGAFQRSFRLPDDVDDAKIEAHVTDGVLEVTVPKSAQAKDRVRKIEIGRK
jgi:HSP20 family protein